MKKNLLLLLLFPIMVLGFGTAVIKKMDTIQPNIPNGVVTVETTGDVDLNVANVLVPTGNFNESTIRDRAASTTDTGIGINGTSGAIYAIINGAQKLAINLGVSQFFTKGQFLVTPQSNTALALQFGEVGSKNTGLHSGDSDADLYLTADSVDVMQLETTQAVILVDTKLNTLTADTVPYLDANKIIKSSAVTPTQLGFVDATSSIQAQLDDKASLTATQSIAGDKSFSGATSFTNSGSIKIPNGTTGEREVAPTNGLFRYNDTDDNFEGYVAGVWGPIGGGGDLDLSAITQDVIPDSDISRNIGSATNAFANVHTLRSDYRFSGASAGTIGVAGGGSQVRVGMNSGKDFVIAGSSSHTFIDQDESLLIRQITSSGNAPFPDANYLYFKSDDKLYSKSSTGVETEIGASVDIDLSAITQSIVSDTDNTYDIGTALLKFKDGYFGNLDSETVVTNILNVSSTTQSSKPCPVMSELEMEAVVTPDDGSCVYNSDAGAQYNYNLGLTEWLVSGAIVNTENITDPIAFTPTGTWSNTTYTGSWERQGKFAIIKFKALATGTPADSVALNFDFSSSGLVIDLTDASILSAIPSQTILGEGVLVDTGSNSYPINAYYSSTTEISMRVRKASTAHVNGQDPVYQSLLGPFSVIAGDFAETEIRVPIVGWESSTKYAVSSCEGLNCFNEFSARIFNNGSASITSESLDFIDTVSRTSQGKVTVTFNSGFFSVPPSCVATAEQASDVNGSTAHNINVSASSIQVWMKYEGVTFSDKAFTLNCQRQGADFFAHDDRFIEINDVENTYSAFVSSGGLVQSESSNFITGDCAVTSVSTYTCAIEPSLSLTVPMACSITSGDAGDMHSAVGVSTTQIVTRSINDAGAASTSGFHMVCHKQGADYKAPKAYVGNLNPSGFVKTAGVAEPRQYSVKINSVGVVSQETGDWIDGNCSTASCNFKAGAFTSPPNCQLSAQDLGNICNPNVSGTTSVGVSCFLHTGGGNSGITKYLSCEGE